MKDGLDDIETEEPACREMPPCSSDSTNHDVRETDESTDLKLAILSSLHPHIDSAIFLDLLVAAEGSVEQVLANRHLFPPDDQVEGACKSPKKRSAGSIGLQTSLAQFRKHSSNDEGTQDAKKRRKTLTRKGQTLHLYSPEDVENHTPCSIIHNFLPAEEADALLEELLVDAPTYGRATFKLFDNVVQSPHSAAFYVSSLEEEQRHRTEYLYNGSFLTDVRQLTPQMQNVSPKVEEAVNREIARRISVFYPNGEKLKYQSPHRWAPNAAFVNCYNGGSESVGYHTDQLTYLGPRAVIGSISLGVAREFRVRKIVARDDDGPNATSADDDGNSAAAETSSAPSLSRADAEGQIAIHLPHNSLLVMHAEMQEEWKHSIHPAGVIDPHPVAGSKRINITYRHYRPAFHPRHTPRCRCGVATVLRCVQRRAATRGRYVWMCHVGNVPGKKSCGFFQWAEFDDDGEPPWSAAHKHDVQDANVTEAAKQ